MHWRSAATWGCSAGWRWASTSGCTRSGRTSSVPGTVAACTAGGALFGAWAASLVGVSAPNGRLRPFDAEFDAGRILLMADVPESRAGEIHELLARQHPEAVERETEFPQ